MTANLIHLCSSNVLVEEKEKAASQSAVVFINEASKAIVSVLHNARDAGPSHNRAD